MPWRPVGSRRCPYVLAPPPLRSGGSIPTLEACLVAAVLNAALSKNYPLTVEYVKKLQSGKVGVPSSNGVVPAYKKDIINYLQQTWDSSN